MKKHQRLLSLILSMLLVLVLFAGCDNTGNTDDDTGDSTATPTATEVTQSDPVESEEVTDDVSVYPLTEEKVELTYWTTLSGGHTAIGEMTDYSWEAAAEELTNVHIEWNTCSSMDGASQLQLILSGGDYFDIMAMFSKEYIGGIAKSVTDGVAYDLMDYIDYIPNYYNLISTIDDYTLKMVTADDGSLPAFYRVRLYEDTTQGYAIRSDYLEAVGMESPATISELEEVLYAFKTELGVEAPLLINMNVQTNTEIVGAFGVSGRTVGRDPTGSFYHIGDTVYNSLVEDGYKEYLTLMNNWYSEGLVVQDFVNVTPLTSSAGFTEYSLTGRSGVFVGNSFGSIEALADDENFKLEGMASPVLEEGDVNHFAYIRRLSTTSASVTTACENPEIAMMWLDFLFSEEGGRFLNFGVEDESYEVVNDEIQLTDLVMGAESPAAEMFRYSCIYQLPGLEYLERWSLLFDEVDAVAFERWNSSSDSENTIPVDFLSYTDEESELITNTLSEILTYADEMIYKFVIGEESIEGKWDEYVAALEELGLPDCIAAMQSAYDCYLVR